MAEILPTNIVKIIAATGFAFIGLRLLLSGEEKSGESEDN